MTLRVADYQLLGPDGDDSESWLAEPPPRLGEPGPVILTRLAPGQAWTAVSERLSAVAAVRSGHLVQLLEAGHTGAGAPAWVSRRCGGTRLTELPIDLPTALRAAAGAARGLHALHEAGWVHGELRAASLLLDGPDGRLVPPLRRLAVGLPTVALVGRSDELDCYEPAALWQSGPSPASDLWALAAAVHRVLTGRLVHPGLAGDTVVTGTQRVLSERPALEPGLPGDVGRLIAACMSAAPEDRPPSAAAVAEQLESVAA